MLPAPPPEHIPPMPEDVVPEDLWRNFHQALPVMQAALNYVQSVGSLRAILATNATGEGVSEDALDDAQRSAQSGLELLIATATAYRRDHP